MLLNHFPLALYTLEQVVKTKLTLSGFVCFSEVQEIVDLDQLLTRAYENKVKMDEEIKRVCENLNGVRM